MAGVVTAWGLRLSWNFWRKGGYSGGEDYRWAVVRDWFPGWRFEVFNFVFIYFFQQMEILAFSAPAVLALQSDAPWNVGDSVATVCPIETAALCIYPFKDGSRGGSVGLDWRVR